MATTVYVNTDNTGTKDGTTFATGYDNLQDAIAAQVSANADRTGDGPLTIYCGGETADTTGALVNGFTLTADDYILITAYTGHRAGCKWDANKYRLEVSNNEAIEIADDFVRVDGLQLYTHTLSESHYVMLINAVAASNDLRISNCLVRGDNDTSYIQHGIYVNDATDAIVKIWNTVVCGIGQVTGSRGILASCATLDLWNCTVIGGEYAVRRAAGTVTAKNTYAGGSSTADWSGTIGKTSCASSDTTSDGTDPHDSVALDTSTFVDPVNATVALRDFALAGTGSGLYGVGADNTGDTAPLNYTTDIDGDTITWRFDIGADWYYAASAGQFARPSSDVAGGTFRSILVTAPFGPRVIA